MYFNISSQRRKCIDWNFFFHRIFIENKWWILKYRFNLAWKYIRVKKYAVGSAFRSNYLYRVKGCEKKKTLNVLFWKIEKILHEEKMEENNLHTLEKFSISHHCLKYLAKLMKQILLYFLSKFWYRIWTILLTWSSVA